MTLDLMVWMLMWFLPVEGGGYPSFGDGDSLLL